MAAVQRLLGAPVGRDVVDGGGGVHGAGHRGAASGGDRAGGGATAPASVVVPHRPYGEPRCAGVRLAGCAGRRAARRGSQRQGAFRRVLVVPGAPTGIRRRDPRQAPRRPILPAARGTLPLAYAVRDARRHPQRCRGGRTQDGVVSFGVDGDRAAWKIAGIVGVNDVYRASARRRRHVRLQRRRWLG